MLRLTHRLYDKYKLIGFGLIDDEGNKSKKALKEVIELIKNKEVYDFRIEEDDDGKEYILSDKIQIYDLPVDTLPGTLRIKDRILDNGKVVGYILETLENSKEVKLKADKVWELAFYGAVQDIKAYLRTDENGNKHKVLIVNK